MASSGKQFGDTSSVEASFRKTEGGSQTSTSGTDNDGIVLVVLFQVSIDEDVEQYWHPAYNNWVLLGNRTFGGLCTKRVGAENASYAIRRLAIATSDHTSPHTGRSRRGKVPSLISKCSRDLIAKYRQPLYRIDDGHEGQWFG